MGTLGLPTFGTRKPSSVETWANFYTSTHSDDAAGAIWADKMPADVNVDLRRYHRDFWLADEVVRATADAVARSWSECDP